MLTYDRDSMLSFDADGDQSPLKALTDPHLRARFPTELARAWRYVASRMTDTGLLVREQPFQGDGLSTTQDAALMARALGAAAVSPSACGLGPLFAELHRAILRGFVDRWRAGFLAGWHRPDGTPTHYRLPQELVDDGNGRRMRHVHSEQTVILALARSGDIECNAVASEMQADLDRFVTPHGLPRYLRESAPGSGVWLPAWELPNLVDGKPVVIDEPGPAYKNRPTWTRARKLAFFTPEIEHQAFWMRKTIADPDEGDFSLAVAVRSIQGCAHEIREARRQGRTTDCARAVWMAHRWMDRVGALMPSLPNAIDAEGVRHSHGRAVMTDRQVACWQASPGLPSALWMLVDAVPGAPDEMERAAEMAEAHVATLVEAQRGGWWAWAVDVARPALGATATAAAEENAPTSVGANGEGS